LQLRSSVTRHLASFLVSALLSLSPALAADKPPVFIGLDAEFGHKTSTSAQAVRQGMEIAIDEINQKGGVLGGRKLELVVMDNRSIPAMGVDNLRALAARPDLVGVFGGKFSPVVMEWIPVAHELGIPVFAPWSSANPITDHDRKPSYSFRLSLKDTWAAPAFMRFAKEERGAQRVGVILPNTAWGRSNQSAIAKASEKSGVVIVGERWYNWGDKTLIEIYHELQKLGAQAIILVANEGEGSILIKEIAALPAADRLPIISHWGITGGAMADLAGDALHKVDLTVVQTYSFIGAKSPAALRVLAALKTRYGIPEAEKIKSPVGVAQAYDLTHILARAIDKAGSTNRRKIRDALEKLGPYDGLVRRYNPPFAPDRHDALTPGDVFMARYTAEDTLVPMPWRKP
jgi:branched-chain amino acid transport system substrate-binding protein